MRRFAYAAVFCDMPIRSQMPFSRCIVRGFENIEVAEKDHVFRPGGFDLCLGSQEFRKIPNFLDAPWVDLKK